MRLWEIPVRVIAADASPGNSGDGSPAGSCAQPGGEHAAGLGSGVYAIVTELTGLLNGLTQEHKPGVIDLRSLPMSEADRTQLREVLGEGEVQASFHAEGISRICETGIAGVWWVEHRDRNGDLIAELIEVASVPEILCSAPDEIAVAGGVLQARVQAMAGVLPKAIGHGLHR